MTTHADIIVIGAGHNGLVAATLLARAGLDVVVFDERDVVGGATKTERPFPRLPGLQQSTGAYLLGLMPPGAAHHAGGPAAAAGTRTTSCRPRAGVPT